MLGTDDGAREAQIGHVGLPDSRDHQLMEELGRLIGVPVENECAKRPSPAALGELATLACQGGSCHVGVSSCPSQRHSRTNGEKKISTTSLPHVFLLFVIIEEI
jgi:hypothetical protein